MLLSIVLSLLLLAVGAGVAWLNLSPEFGKAPNSQHRNALAKSPQWRNGKFDSSVPVMSGESQWKTMRKFMAKRTEPRPSVDLIPERISPQQLALPSDSLARIYWFGHSAVLLQWQGRTILLDPMLGQYTSPVPLATSKRFSSKLPIELDELPPIDALVLSHDHYDHLDYGTIRAIMPKVGHFYVPLGVGSHLRAWGVEEARLTELDWWQSVQLPGADTLELVCAPAQHFSGRALFDRGATLWCSWVLQGTAQRIFFSGDSGYGPHFKEIGKRFGSFDLAMVECGQYNEDWMYIHMMPEETAQAAQDLGAKALMPIHWGAFTLALHPWTESVERVARAANGIGVPLCFPTIGAEIRLGSKLPQQYWWRELVQ